LFTGSTSVLQGQELLPLKNLVGRHLVERKNVEREKIRGKYRKEKCSRGKMSKLKIMRESDFSGDWRH
jgi:hypothetical protein